MAEVLKVKIRKERGKRNNKRLRQSGVIPAVLYGHGKKNVVLSVPHEPLEAVVRQGSRLVELAGGAKGNALIREIQWDTFGLDILHVDFTRVTADERIEVQVAVELRGVAPGASEGGVVEHLVHRVDLECLALSIPTKFELNINQLNLGDSLTVSNIEFPEGVRLLTDPETVIVQCVQRAEEEEEEEIEAVGAEPEVIGRKPEDEKEPS